MDVQRRQDRPRHEHNYKLASVKNNFEVTPVVDPITNLPLYKMVEYAYLICNCTDVVKRKVKNGQ